MHKTMKAFAVWPRVDHVLFFFFKDIIEINMKIIKTPHDFGKKKTHTHTYFLTWVDKLILHAFTVKLKVT